MTQTSLTRCDHCQRVEDLDSRWACQAEGWTRVIFQGPDYKNTSANGPSGERKVYDICPVCTVVFRNWVTDPSAK